MRGLLNIQWRLVAAVVGVSFVCLYALNLYNSRLSDLHTVENGRALTAEAARFQAARFHQIAESVHTILDVLDVRVVAELEYTKEHRRPPDLDRLAAFVSANLVGTSTNLRELSVTLAPGVVEPRRGTERFFNDRDFAVIGFSREADQPPLFRQPPSSDSIAGSRWWRDVTEGKEVIVVEPSFEFHVIATTGG